MAKEMTEMGWNNYDKVNYRDIQDQEYSGARYGQKRRMKEMSFELEQCCCDFLYISVLLIIELTPPLVNLR
jgi:hypothetical protein